MTPPRSTSGSLPRRSAETPTSLPMLAATCCGWATPATWTPVARSLTTRWRWSSRHPLTSRGRSTRRRSGRGHVPADYVALPGDAQGCLRGVCAASWSRGGGSPSTSPTWAVARYRSLSADVIGILQDDLGLLLRGEVIWRKAEGAAGNLCVGELSASCQPCAAGSHRAGGDRLQGPLRPGVVSGQEGCSGAALAPDRECRRVHGRHHRRVGHTGRIGYSGSASSALPG